MTQRDITRVWQKLSTYLVVYAAATWIVTQGIIQNFGVAVDHRRSIAALFGLLICIPLYLLCIWFASRHAATYGGSSWHSRLPAIGLEDDLDVGSPEGRMYQRFYLTVFVQV
jgi:hypothetical protein